MAENYMIFQERKKGTGFEYKVEDLFGTIAIESPNKLNGQLLDEIVVILLRTTSTGNASGVVKVTENETIKYEFVRASQWDDGEDDDTEICLNLHTSTVKRVTGAAVIALLFSKIKKIGNWFKRFVVAFQEAWRKQQ
jgi:hypothetical protein